MHKIAKMIDIDAPADRVYDYLTQPTNLPGIWPNMVSVSNVVTKPGGASEFDWIYKMGGLPLKGHSKTDEAERPKLLRMSSEGGIASVFRWTFQGTSSGGTRLVVEVEYTIPAPVIGKLAEAFVAKSNERELETLLANLKDMMETAGADKAVGASARPH